MKRIILPLNAKWPKFVRHAHNVAAKRKFENNQVLREIRIAT
jgi:hypothetical protein